MDLLRGVFVGLVMAVVAVAGATATPGAGIARTEPFAFRFALPIVYLHIARPAGSPDGLECFMRTGKGIVPGLGTVEESYAYLLQNDPPGCPHETFGLLPTAGRLSVPGKGQISFHVDGTTGCLTRDEVVRATETFAITGGTSIYTGAFGGGTLAHVSDGPPTFHGQDTWTGTLAVPGLDFDLTPPVINGAHGKTVRAPRRATRVRVIFGVTARDEADGAVPVTCKPKSRSWFKVGRTRVRCSASDTSANRSQATFVVTVKQRR